METFRDWRSVYACDASEQLVESELARFNYFADGFLQDTSEEKTRLSKKQQAELLEKALHLQPLLDGFGNLIFQIPSCPFSRNPQIISLTRRASGLLSLSRQRVQQAPTLLSALMKDPVTVWKEAQPAAIAKARQEWCPPAGQRSPSPDIFYASEDETLRREWLFCDDTKMVALHGEEASLIHPKNPQPRQRYSKKLYLEAAENYPDSQIQRPPQQVNVE